MINVHHGPAAAPWPIIYIVDDDLEFRKSLARLLKSAGYRTESFPSGQSFLDSVPVQTTGGVLLLDLRMPGMDGFALHDKLEEYRSPMKVIIITADAHPGDREHAMDHGAVGFLLKPFQEESLLGLLQETMDPVPEN
jgi:FixJ family two-component response regulator